jgi:hypothetical protein
MPAFCGSKPAVDLDEQLWAMAQLLRQTRQSGRQFGAVQSVETIKQAHGCPGFIGLQRSKQVHFGIGECFLELRPFAFCFLHAILTKDPMTLLQYRQNTIIRLHF